jgi:hypothetical protein
VSSPLCLLKHSRSLNQQFLRSVKTRGRTAAESWQGEKAGGFEWENIECSTKSMTLHAELPFFMLAIDGIFTGNL